MTQTQTFLDELLAGGPRVASDCYAEAAEVGIGERQLRRAAAGLGVVREQSPDGAVWRLPHQASPAVHGQCAEAGAAAPLCTYCANPALPDRPLFPTQDGSLVHDWPYGRECRAVSTGMVRQSQSAFAEGTCRWCGGEATADAPLVAHDDGRFGHTWPNGDDDYPCPPLPPGYGDCDFCACAFPLGRLVRRAYRRGSAPRGFEDGYLICPECRQGSARGSGGAW